MQKDLSKAITMENMDNGMGVLFPFYDEGTKMVYLVGKASLVRVESGSGSGWIRDRSTVEWSQ